MESFGTELKETPTPLIAALGPFELQNKVLPHLRTVNEGFMLKLRIASLPRAHRLPVKKELREKHGTFSNQMQRDLGTYRTQGILKTQWLKKHHELLPAVVLLLDEFDPRWTRLDWQQKETALVDDVTQLKRTVSAREGRVVVLLVQQVDDADGTWRNGTEERLADLRRRLDTDAKGLVLVTSKDMTRTSSVMVKLESSVRTMALEYYKAQSKRVKRYEKACARTPEYQALHARFCFKIAHFYEFRRCTTKVLQYYEASYCAIIALPLQKDGGADGIAYKQVMTMAEFVNFKLCYHLIFSSNNVKDAVDQLRRHVGVYASAIVVADRAYEHWAWVSRQYHVFAQLLVEALSIRGSLPSTGLESSVYKEPYLYFSLAAKYAIFRRKAAMKLGLTTASTVQTVMENGESMSERNFVVVPSSFVGGDPLVSEVMAAPQDQSVAALVKYRYTIEKSVPHVTQSLALLEHALQYLTTYEAEQDAPRNRLKGRLLVHLGTERLASGEYDRSRMELQKAKEIFSTENCWAQTAQILKQLLICTFCQGDTGAYMDYSLQLLSPFVEEFVSLKERSRIQDSFLTAWRDPASLGAPFAQNSALQNVHELALDQSRAVFALTARFDRASACVNEDVTLELKLRSHFPLPLVISRMELVFNDERYRTMLYHQAGAESDTMTCVDGGFSTSLEFTHKLVKEIRVPLRVLDERQLLSIQEVRLYCGGDVGVETEHTAIDGKETDAVLVFNLPVTLASVERLVAPPPYLISGRVPSMGNGSASPSFSKRKSMFSLVEGPRAAHVDIREPIEEDGSKHLRGSSLLIVQPRANATLSLPLNEPLLTGDFRELAFRLAANEDTLENVTFQISCKPPPTSAASEDAFFFVEQSGVMTPMPLDTNLQPQDRILLLDQNAHTEEVVHIIVRSTKVASLTLIASVAYTTNSGASVNLTERFRLICHDPFAIHGGFVSDYLTGGGVPGAAQRPKGSYGCVGSLVNYRGSITCTSGGVLRVLAVHFEPHDANMEEVVATSGFGSISTTLDRSDSKNVCATFIDGDSWCFCLRLRPKVASPFVTLGRVEIVWKRESSPIGNAPDGGSNDVVHTWLDIPLVSIVAAPLTISVETPPFGVEGVLDYMNVRVKNNEAVLHSLQVKSVDAEQAFFISGRTNGTEHLLPFEERVFRLGLVPTKTGYLRLPRFEIMSLTYDFPFTNPDECHELFVLPRGYPDWLLEPAK